MNDIVAPVYAAFALVFWGLFAASTLQGATQYAAYSRSLRLAGAAALLAALACVCIALLPLVGRSALVLSTAFLLGSYAVMYLRFRSWHMVVSNRRILWTSLVVASLCVLNGGLAAMQAALPLRVIYQCLLANGLLALALYELQQSSSEVGRSPMIILRWSLLAMMVFITFWSWVIYQQHTFGGVVIFRTNLSEPWLAFVLRLFLTACLLLAHVSANAYALEQMTHLRMKTLSQLAKVEEERNSLEQSLKEKNDLLKTASFAVRSQNLPAIMSSLSHEINQPLGAIRLNADYLMAEIEKIAPAERQKLLSSVVKGSESISSVVTSFRRFFEVSVDHQSVQMNTLLTDLIRGLRTEFLHKEAHVEYVPLGPVEVYGDAVQLESAVKGVIDHLLELPFSSVKTLRIDCSKANSLAIVRFLTVDCSMSKVEFEKIFDRSIKDSSGRFRPGLWLSLAIVEHHGGAIGVCEAEEGLGISLQLPIQEESK